jgi:hypothetical protein
MTLTFDWYLQGSSDTKIDDTDKLLFSSGEFDERIVAGKCNDSTHVKTDVGANKSDGNSPNNNKYLTNSTASLNGGLPRNINTVLDSEATIKLELNLGDDFQVEDAIFYAYQESSNVSPDGLIFYSAETGNSKWSDIGGRGNALELGDKTIDSNKQTYYLLASVCLTAGGRQTGTMKFEGVIK